MDHEDRVLRRVEDELRRILAVPLGTEDDLRSLDVLEKAGQMLYLKRQRGQLRFIGRITSLTAAPPPELSIFATDQTIILLALLVGAVAFCAVFFGIRLRRKNRNKKPKTKFSS